MTIYTTQQETVRTKPVQGNVTVYNLMTGAADTCAPIDARERVSRGGWSFDPPAMEPAQEDEQSMDDFVPDETVPPKRKNKKGR